MELFRHRLDAYANEWRQRSGFQTRRHLPRRGLRVAVLFRINAVAVAVLEIYPEIFDWLATEFFDDASADGCGIDVRAEPERSDQCLSVRGVFVQRGECNCTQLRRGISLEQVRAAIHRVHRLPVATLPREIPSDDLIRAAKPCLRGQILFLAHLISQEDTRSPSSIADIRAKNKI